MKWRNIVSSLDLDSTGTVLNNWHTKSSHVCVVFSTKGMLGSFSGCIVRLSPEDVLIGNMEPWAGRPQEQIKIEFRSINTFEYYAASEVEPLGAYYKQFCGLISSILVMTGEHVKFAICERVRSA
jgi:hypothetical protein